jgi:hypothetical protein
VATDNLDVPPGILLGGLKTTEVSAATENEIGYLLNTSRCAGAELPCSVMLLRLLSMNQAYKGTRPCPILEIILNISGSQEENHGKVDSIPELSRQDPVILVQHKTINRHKYGEYETKI